jgi:hypothetical protein
MDLLSVACLMLPNLRLTTSLLLFIVFICELSLLLQVHWVFGSRLRNSSVTLADASLELMHEAPPAGAGKRE